MPIKQQVDSDLKAALLGGDKNRVTVLRGLKSVFLNAEIATGKRQSGLNDEEVLGLLAKEVKQRLESAELYTQGGNQARADDELAEKAIIENYMPTQLSDEKLRTIIKQVIEDLGPLDQHALGKVIGAVRAKTAGRADGGRIAAVVKDELA